MLACVVQSCVFLVAWERADILAVACVAFSSALSLSQMWPGPHQN